MGTMATLSPITKSEDCPRSAATMAAMKKAPTTAIRHPLKAPKKNSPVRDFRRGGVVSGNGSISDIAQLFVVVSGVTVAVVSASAAAGAGAVGVSGARTTA